jgi:hypothetical protein
MPPVRSSRRAKGKSPPAILSTKRVRKPPTSSLSAFDASRPLPKASKRPNGRRKAKTLSGQSTPVPAAPTPAPRARGSIIKIGSTPILATSPVTVTTTTTPSKRTKTQAITNPFNPTTY